VAREVSTDEVMAALSRINYPDYPTDIVSLGIVEQIVSADNGGIVLTLRQATAREEVMRQIASEVHRVLTHELGIHAEFRVHPIAAELGETTGRVRMAGTAHVVAVASGKGGVGKSTVAANLAVALGQLGLKVGLLDADIYGPSVPMMFGIGAERPKAAGDKSFHPIEKYGVKLISIGFFVTDKTPVIWRGPMVMSAVRQFLNDTVWGTNDFLVVDLPPGTGDAQLTLAQLVSIDGVVIVTTPQEIATLDAERAVRMFRQVNCPILGVVENMSYFVCPDCGERDDLFGTGGGAKMAKEEGVPLLAQIPIFAEIREASDRGMPLTLAHPEHPASAAFIELARRVAAATPD
jgi:ATP-binding protein involved in chromosome partitioning